MAFSQEKIPAPQRLIEEEITKVVNLGNIRAAFLFSEEGLSLAEVPGDNTTSVSQALELALSVQDAVNLLNEREQLQGTRELIFVTHSRTRYVIRYFKAFAQRVTLVLVVPPGKTYRAHTNRIIRAIKNISKL